MSRQLSIASAFSILALSALALFAPAVSDTPANEKAGAAFSIAAPALFSTASLID